MRIREFAATALGDAIEGRVRFGQPPIILDAPPSQSAKYPALAVWIERATPDFSYASPVLVGDDGQPIFGPDATDEDGVIRDGDVYMVGDGTWLDSVGSLRCSGRIWCGARYSGDREKAEEKVWFAFMENRSAPGRLEFSLETMTIGDFTINFGTGTAMLVDSQWVGEHAFEARLWSWTRFDLDLPLLVPRTDPLAHQLVLEFSRVLSVEINTPTDVPKLPDLEKFLINSDGTYTPTDL